MAQEIKNILFLVVIGTFSIIYYLDVQTLPQPEERNLVIILIWSIGILLIADLGRTMFRGWKNRNSNDSSFLRDVIKWLRSRQSILVFSTIIYVLLLPVIGFFTTSLLFIITLNFFLDSRKIWEITVLPIGLLTIIYVLFVVLLKINLPEGILF